MEEGQVDEESRDSQVVDSTSYTHEVGDSDRELDYEEGSVGHSSQSGYQSDEDQGYQQQYVGEYEEADASDQDVPMEDDTVDNQPESDRSVTPRTPEEPEEGEVIDDNSESGETSNGKSAITEKKVSGSDVPEVKLSENSEKDADTSVVCESKEEHNAETEKDKDTAEKAKKFETVDNEVDAETKDTFVGGENGTKTVDTSSKAGSTEKTLETSKNVDTDTRIVKTEKTVNDAKIEEKGSDVTDEIEDHIINVEADHVIDEEASNIEAEHGAGDIPDEGELSEEEKETETEVEKSEPEVVVSEVKKGKPRRIVKPPSQDIAPALTRNQMELLELEMRARAIKAMLKTAK